MKELDQRLLSQFIVVCVVLIIIILFLLVEENIDCVVLNSIYNQVD